MDATRSPIEQKDHMPPRHQRSVQPTAQRVALGTGTVTRPAPGQRSPLGHPGHSTSNTRGEVVTVQSSQSSGQSLVETIQSSQSSGLGLRLPRDPVRSLTAGPSMAHGTPGSGTPGSRRVGEDETAFDREPPVAHNGPWFLGPGALGNQEAVESSHSHTLYQRMFTLGAGLKSQ